MCYGVWLYHRCELTPLPSLIWFTPASTDGSSDVQAGRVVITQADLQNCRVISVGSVVPEIYSFLEEHY